MILKSNQTVYLRFVKILIISLTQRLGKLLEFDSKHMKLFLVAI